MNLSESENINKQFRKAAILLASLDEHLAEQLLAEMPPAEAEQVRQAILLLDEVEPGEQAGVLEEFHRNRQQPSTYNHSSTDGVEFDPSLLARINQPDSEIYGPQQQAVNNSLDDLSDSEAETIVETLLQEHPQTIALILSRLTHQVAGKIVSLLPATLQQEVLNRVSELDPADESCSQIVESHLSRWVKEHRQRKHRIAAGKELVEKIQKHIPAQDHGVVVGKIRRGQSELPRTISERKPNRSKQHGNVPRTYKRPRYQLLPSRRGTESSERYKNIDQDNPLDVLETASNADLVTALTNIEASVVTLALAGASEKLLSRIFGRLPRRQAKVLRQQLHSIGPTRLGDMLEAQMQLARYVKDVQE